MRKLASIQKIINLEPIEGKDRIEFATILGWHVIVQKGEFNVGDLCVYIEYDTILPEKPEFEFLRKRCYVKSWNGFRIRNMKMAGVFSSGIVFDLNILPNRKYFEGMDVSKKIGVKKYDPELLIEIKNKDKIHPFQRWIYKYFPFIAKIIFKKKGYRKFPTHLVSKTDEIRVQNIPHVVEEYKGTKVYITEKLDGQSATYIWHKNKFWVCSRNIVNNSEYSTYGKIAKKYNIKNTLKNYCKRCGKTNAIAIQGEIVGEGVGNGCGKNLYNIDGVDFYLFNVIDLETKKVASFRETLEFAEACHFKFVPILATETFLPNNVDVIVEMAKGISELANVNREGIVIRDVNNEKRAIRDLGEILSFKAINPDFLIEHKM